MRKALIATAFAFLLVALCGVTSARAESLRVCDDADVCQYATIQEAVDHARTGDEILVNVDGVHTEAGIVIDKDLTIRGLDPNGTTVQAAAEPCLADADRVFRITAAKVTIADLAVRNGCSIAGMENRMYGGQGGAIWSSGTLVLRNVVLANNQVAQNAKAATVGTIGGGAVYSIGSLSIINSTLNDNKALGDNGAAYGGAWFNKGYGLVFNSTFSHNSVEGKEALGGAIYNDDTLALTFGTIVLNEAGTAGGGLFTRGSTEASNSVIAQNKVTGGDGGADCDAGDAIGGMSASNTWATVGGCGLVTNSHLFFEDLIVVRPGRTPVHMPRYDSAAVGAADCSDSKALGDQLNQPRPATTCTIGAVELPRVLLPVVMSPAPTDLEIVDLRISPSSGLRVGTPVEITIVLRNRGGLISDKNFWVDLYINPTVEPPNRLNNSEVWRLLCHPVDVGQPACYNDQGIAWQITDYVHVGETVIITSKLDDIYLKRAESNWRGFFNRAGEKNLWAFVDSWGGDGVKNGLINELPNGENNNLFGPVRVTVDSASVAAADNAAPEDDTPVRLREITITP